MLLGALAARQLVVLYEHRRDWAGTWVPAWPRSPSRGRPRRSSGFGIRVLLPTDAGPALTLSGGLGGHNFQTNDGFYRQTLAELLASRTRSTARCSSALLVFLLVLALGRDGARRRRDPPAQRLHARPVPVYLVLPYREGRYLLGVVPFLLYFAAQGLRGTDIRSWPIQARHVLLLALVASPRPGHRQRLRLLAHLSPRHRRAVDRPRSQEMFAAVDTFTGPDDTIVFFRPRALNLFTDRDRLTAGSSLPVLLERGDWYAMAKASEYAQCALDGRGGGRHRAAHEGLGERGLGVVARATTGRGTYRPAVAIDVSTCRL